MHFGSTATATQPPYLNAACLARASYSQAIITQGNKHEIKHGTSTAITCRGYALSNHLEKLYLPSINRYPIYSNYAGTMHITY